MNLTIVDSERGSEPLVILSEDEKGLQVVGGDPRMVQSLQLNRFNNLKEIADFINSSGGKLQAMFDGVGEGEEAEAPGEDNPDLDDRIRPALDIIKDLLERVKARKEAEGAQEDVPEEADDEEEDNAQEMKENTDTKAVSDPSTSFVYVSVDGDNIGNAVARAEEQDDEKTLAEMSQKINAGQDVFKEWATSSGGQIIEAGGDEGVAKVPQTALQSLEQMREQYRQVVGATLTVGVGTKISECTKARMLGKLKGKNQVVTFDESTPKELELRLQDQDASEGNKIRTAMTPNPTGEQGAPVAVHPEMEEGVGDDTGSDPDADGAEPTDQDDGEEVPLSSEDVMGSDSPRIREGDEAEQKRKAMSKSLFDQHRTLARKTGASPRFLNNIHRTFFGDKE